jgi:alkanesulfonate monooxygenase SsuD/methylene tetrahydromethanopterin reductase-like flavin-dependent oxidoreductase (luciferase family)
MPLYLAATGPKMCALAGEIADGIYLPYGTPDFLGRTLADSRERRPDDKPFEVACQALLSVDDDLDVARSRVKASIGFILTEPNGEDVLRGNGIDPAKAEPIRAGLKAGGVRAMVGAVDDEIVDRLTIAGSAEHCLARLEEMVALGVTHVTVSLLDDEPAPALDLLAAFTKSGARA